VLLGFGELGCLVNGGMVLLVFFGKGGSVVVENVSVGVDRSM